MAAIALLLCTAYIVFIWYLFPSGRNSLDVFKLNPVLLPYWWKFIGLGCIASVFVYSIVEGDFNPSTNRFLLSGMYFGLLQIAFSKEKNEDEFALQIRIKAMYITIISIFFVVGMISSFSVIAPDAVQNDSFFFMMLMFNSVLIVYLTYFYWTKYGFKKNKDEK